MDASSSMLDAKRSARAYFFFLKLFVLCFQTFLKKTKKKYSFKTTTPTYTTSF